MTSASDGRGEQSAASSTPEFPPTLREVLLRPRWLGTLLLCLVVAGVFAWLGQWQLDRAREIWRKKFGQAAADASERARQIRFLVSRGFAADVVRRVVQGADEA